MSSFQKASDDRPTGLREGAKFDKRQRIMRAARDVFTEYGFEAATTRAIAKNAGVSLGTIFLYAQNKRDLLLLLVNDELDAISSNVHDSPISSSSLLEKLLCFFEPRYHYWATEPRLARAVLQETFDFLVPDLTRGAEAQRFYARRAALLRQISTIMEQAQAESLIAADVDCHQATMLSFNLYLIEVRQWLLQENPDPDFGLEQLRKVLALFLRGITANPA